MSKYHSRKVKTADGQVFDSIKEYKRWLDLRLLERSGAIQGLQRQVRYVLIPAQREAPQEPKKGRRRVIERECSYVADFVYTRDGQLVVEDTKGVRTEAYRIKRKLMLWVHGIRILET